MTAGPTAIIYALESYLARAGLIQKLKEQLAVASWARIVGRDVASKTTPLSVSNGILYIAVDSPSWACEISFLKEHIIRQLNEIVKEEVIRDIRSEVARKPRNQYIATGGEGDESGEVFDVKWLDEVSLPERVLLAIEGMVNNIQDPAMAARLRLLLTRIKKSDVWKESKGWNRCPTCRALKTPSLKECPVCRHSGKSERMSKLRGFLLNCPWLSYEEAAQELSDIEPEEFKLTRQALIEDIERELEAALIAQMGRKETPDCNQSLQLYVLLKTGKSPFDLTIEDILESLGAKFSRLSLKKGAFGDVPTHRVRFDN